MIAATATSSSSVFVDEYGNKYIAEMKEKNRETHTKQKDERISVEALQKRGKATNSKHVNKHR